MSANGNGYYQSRNHLCDNLSDNLLRRLRCNVLWLRCNVSHNCLSHSVPHDLLRLRLRCHVL
jgi:hypothetical protein